MRYLFLVLSLSLLAACSSEEPTPEPAPEVAALPAEPAPAAKPKSKKRRTKNRRRRTKKGVKKRTKRPAQEIPDGHLYLAFNKADLKTQVLPAIESQAGIKITWLGTRRQVNLSLKRSLPFAEAMDLICRFSDTHLVRAYSGRYELRDGYKGQLESEGLTLDTGKSGGGAASKGGKSGTSKPARRPVARGKARPSGKGAAKGSTPDPTTGRRSGHEAKGILQDLGTNSTGRRGR
tara:strand:- start:43 stop:744 length:702 start_codon:yes stop_codon:yes gene_type:complete